MSLICGKDGSTTSEVFARINKGDIKDTMTDLLSVDTSVTFSVNVKGYHAENDGGGGLFNYDSTIDKSTANGGTIIDPGQTLANQGNGVGLGCWVRQYSGAVNVLWFGAYNNNNIPLVDITTTAIQKVFDIANEIFIPAGIYIVNGLTIGKTVSIIGENTNTMIGASTEGGTQLRLFEGTSSTYLLHYNIDVESGILKNIELNGNSYAVGQTTITDGILLPDATSITETNLRITNVIVKYFTGNGIKAGLKRGSGKVKSSTFWKCDDTAVYLNSPDWLIQGCSVGDSDTGIFMSNWTEKIIGNDIWGCRVGIKMDSSSCRYITIANNVLDTLAEQSISSDSTSLIESLSIIGNVFRTLQTATVPCIQIEMQESTIIGNVFADPYDDSAPLTTYSIYMASDTRNNVFGNSFGASANTVGNASIGGTDASNKITTRAMFTDRVGFYGNAPAAQPTVYGSRGTETALVLERLLTGLSSLGLIIDSTTA